MVNLFFYRPKMTKVFLIKQIDQPWRNGVRAPVCFEPASR
jgi:hypothetical protein